MFPVVEWPAVYGAPVPLFRTVGKASRAVDYLGHMVEAIDWIATDAAVLKPEAFLHTTLVQDAVVRNFEIIGETARNIAREAPEIAAAHPEIPWFAMAAMRNRLAHGYFSVDFESVWVTARDNLPPLCDQIERLYGASSRQESP